MTYDLTPLRKKSFYGKASVEVHENGTHVLTSYDTQVASYNPNTKNLDIKGWYSSTTARHINAFLNHHGLSTMNKAEMQV